LESILIGISGGSGAGKSTLCTALQDKYPDQIGLVQLDDYFKPSAEAPTHEGYSNKEHPDALYFDKFNEDLEKLSQGNSVVINTKNERLNPEFKVTKKRIPVEVRAKPIMLVEGFLVLFDERVRKLFHTSIWLDVDHETRWERRVHFKNSEYEKKVLIPMHKKFAEPTKQFAAHVIDVSRLTREQVLAEAENIIGLKK